MRFNSVFVLAITTFTCAGVYVAQALGRDTTRATYVEEIPRGYRDWKLISVAREEGPLDDIRAIIGNDLAIKTFREGKKAFPDGAIIARLAWA